MRIAAAGLALLGVITLSGCGAPSLDSACSAIDDAVDRVVIEVASVAHDDTADGADFAAAAEEVEKLVPGVREAEMPPGLADARDALLDRMDELVETLRDGNAGHAVTLAADMQVIQVGADPVCNG